MHGWRHGRGRGGGRPRQIRRFVEPAVLLMLHAGPNHGYGIAAGLGELGLQDYAVDPSVIYRVLYSLEEQGMVNSTRDAAESAGPPRRVYELTRAGDAHLRAWVDDLHETERMLRNFLDVYARAHEQGAPAETGRIERNGPVEEGEETA